MLIGTREMLSAWRVAVTVISLITSDGTESERVPDSAAVASMQAAARLPAAPTTSTNASVIFFIANSRDISVALTGVRVVLEHIRHWSTAEEVAWMDEVGATRAPAMDKTNTMRGRCRIASEATAACLAAVPAWSEVSSQRRWLSRR
jgi:hypothetical protein